MGLTIHYHLTTPLIKVKDIRSLLESLRQMAKRLPFQEVDDLVEFAGPELDGQNHDDPHQWLKIQAGQFVMDGERYLRVCPSHIVAFSTWPGEGCEEANFGFCRYPAMTECPYTNKLRPTNLLGWSWRSFCKTQYASNPECGGIENFLRCHLSVVKLLDFAKKTDLIEVEVQDEGDYWELRDLKKLAEQVGQWNELVAAMAGAFKDTAQAQGMVCESAITGFQDFEHLEAKGLERLKHLKAKLADDDR